MLSYRGLNKRLAGGLIKEMPTAIWIDAGGIVLGSAVGYALRRFITRRLKENMNLALGAVSVAIGVQLLGAAAHLAAAVLALLAGGTLGYALRLDSRLSGVSQLLSKSDSGEFARTFLVAFTLLCTSTTGIVGAMELGLSGNAGVLTTKAIMDFVASVFFAANGGILLAVIAVPVMAVLLLFYSISGLIMPYLTEEIIGDFSACGGLIQLLNAIRIAGLKDVPVADFLPSLMIVFFFSAFRAQLF